MACQSYAPVYEFFYLLDPNQDSQKVLGYYPSEPEKDPLKKIIGFDCTLGLGTSSSVLTITLSGHYGTFSKVGSCVGFVCDQFRFGGVLQSIEHSSDSSGPKTKIVVNDAKSLLSRYDIFLDSQASVQQISQLGNNINVTITRNNGWNAKNAYRLTEGSSWGKGIVSNYGSSEINYWNYGLRLPNVGNCSEFGRSTDYVMAIGNFSYYQILKQLAIYNPDIYNDDPAGLGVWNPVYIYLGAVRNIAAEIPYLGTSAKSITLLDLINNVCEEAGYDWSFSDLVGNNWIGMKFIDKKQKTTFGTIANRIEAAKTSKTLVNYSVGAEFKDEKTRRIVVGSKVEYVKEMWFANGFQTARREWPLYDRDHYSAYVMGFNRNNQPILAYSSDFAVPVDSQNLSAALDTGGYSGFATQRTLYEWEILCTQTLATWKLAGIMFQQSISRSVMDFLGIDWQTGYDIIQSALGGDTHTVSMAAVEAVKSVSRKTYEIMLYEEMAYSWIQDYINTWYGKYYMVILPKATCTFDITGNTQRTGVFNGAGGGKMLMDEPIDSGWSDNGSDCIGLVDRRRFIDGTGKIQSFCGIWQYDYMNRYMGNSNRSFYFDATKFQGDYTKDNQWFFAKADVDGRAFNIGGDLGILIKMPNFIPQTAVLPSAANCNGLRMLEMMFGGANGFSVYGGTTDFSYTNIFKERPAAGRFGRIAVPFRNRAMNYGQFNSRSLADLTLTQGGCELKVVEDLNPWTYGGYGNMIAAGNRLAADGIKQRTKYESGSLTLAETPKRNMEAGGPSGMDPNIDSIVVKFDGNGGATTTYNYRTYTRKFGQSAEAFNAYVKLGVAERRANQSVLNARQLEMQQGFSRGLRSLGNIRQQLFDRINEPASSSSASLTSVLILSYPDQPGYYGYRAEGGFEKKYGSDYFQDADNYEAYAVVSLDMLYLPVSVNRDVIPNRFMGKLASAFSYASNNWPTNKPFPSMPPVNNATATSLQGTLPILNIHLNPYTTQSMLGGWGDSRGGGYGFNAEYVSHGSDPSNVYSVTDSAANARDNSIDVRAAALRGPLLLQSWGYDTNGKPIPNATDTFDDAKAGTFNNTQITEEFAYNWLSNPQCWPCGPIDLRWDRDRCVWVSPPSERLVIAEMMEDLNLGGMARAKLVDYGGVGYYSNQYSDSNGTPMNGSLDSAIIYVYDMLKRPINSGSRIVAYHWGVSADYVAISVADTFYDAQMAQACCTGTSNDPTNPCYYYGQEIPNSVEYWEGGSAPWMEGWKVFNNAYPKKVAIQLTNLFGDGLDQDLVSNGQVRVLGYSRIGTNGLPCLTGIPVVDCTGNYPGGPDDPENPI